MAKSAEDLLQSLCQIASAALVASHLGFDDNAIFCSIRWSIQFGLSGSMVSFNMNREHDLTPSSLSVLT